MIINFSNKIYVMICYFSAVYCISYSMFGMQIFCFYIIFMKHSWQLCKIHLGNIPTGVKLSTSADEKRYHANNPNTLCVLHDIVWRMKLLGASITVWNDLFSAAWAKFWRSTWLRDTVCSTSPLLSVCIMLRHPNTDTHDFRCP